jgi:hypothetical protein
MWGMVEKVLALFRNRSEECISKPSPNVRVLCNNCEDTQIQTMVCHFDASKPQSTKVQVVTRDMINPESIDLTKQAISALIKEDIKPFECGINVNGQMHDESANCANSTYNELDGFYCKVRRLHQLDKEKSKYEWMDCMIEFYWQDGVGPKGLVFLEDAGFIHTYE